jgi:uncharacterized DUF497 family protein
VSSGYRGFEWDPQKSERTKRLRGFDFLAATRVFQDPDALHDIGRHIDGEQRFVVIGAVPIVGMLFVVWTPRGENQRIISARRANRAERFLYETINELD